MRIKQTLLAFAAIVAFGTVVSFAPVAMAAENDCGDDDPTTTCQECAGVDTAIIGCPQTGGDNPAPQQSGVWGLLLITLNIMTAGVGIAAVGGIVWAAILYSSAADSAEQVKKAKEIIRNVAIGLISYALMYLFLNFLIPGGIFSA